MHWSWPYLWEFRDVVFNREESPMIGPNRFCLILTSYLPQECSCTYSYLHTVKLIVAGE